MKKIYLLIAFLSVLSNAPLFSNKMQTNCGMVTFQSIQNSNKTIYCDECSVRENVHINATRIVIIPAVERLYSFNESQLFQKTKILLSKKNDSQVNPEISKNSLYIQKCSLII
jgi:hypothetical protein